MTGSNEMNRKCPRCEKVLEPYQIGLVTLDRCPACSGLWFDRGEFDRSVRIVTGSYDKTFQLESMLETVASRQENGEKLPCPSCRGGLTRWDVRDPEVEIDTCARCRGLWLDRGEFETLHNAVEEKRPRLSSKDLEEIRSRPVQSIGVSAMEGLAGAVVGAVTDRTNPAVLVVDEGWSLISFFDDILG